MKHISHHILGDTNYGRGEHNKLIRENFACHRLLLHSNSLRLKHPYTNEILVLNATCDTVFAHIFEAFAWSEILKEKLAF